MKKGLLIVYTGNGKGKTTAALGQALRAMGHGLKVCVVQFIKGSWKYGELTSAKRFEGLMDFHVKGLGFTWKSKDIEKDVAAAQEALAFSKDMILSRKYDMIILDELTYLFTYNMVNEEETVNFLVNRPKGIHIVVTGRQAPQSLIDAADLVTDMVEVKHPLSAGLKAQRGIEF